MELVLNKKTWGVCLCKLKCFSGHTRGLGTIPIHIGGGGTLTGGRYAHVGESVRNAVEIMSYLENVDSNLSQKLSQKEGRRKS